MLEMSRMLNFSVGPVRLSESVCSMGGEQIPYFRTDEFSKVMMENERLIKTFVGAAKKSRCVFITGSGTAAMEASVINTLSTSDKVLVINGGSFGERFAQICQIHKIPYSEIVLEYGKALTMRELEKYRDEGYTALLVNAHETSTGVYYDVDMIGRFCQENGIFLIVDAISTFLANEFWMKEVGADVVIIGSQKALACPPGISIIVMSEKAVNRVWENETTSMYLDLKRALQDAERGQTPFTPAVGILYQINVRLREIEKMGGVAKEVERIGKLAADFRKKIKDLPFEITSESMSNAVTPLHPVTSVSAYEVFLRLKEEYGIWVCPNGGVLKEQIFRVGHLGALSETENTILVEALKNIGAKK